MMRRYTYNNIVKAARLLSLVVLMAFGAGLKGWGQVGVPGDNYHKEWEFCYDRPNVTIKNKTSSSPLSETTDTIYVMPGKTVDITLQYAPSGENINGYVRWYVQSGDSEVIDNLIRGGHNSNDNNLGITLWPQETLVQYKNGYAWFRYAKRYSSNVPAPQEGYTNILSNLRGNNGDIHSGNIPDVACYITYKCDVNYDNSNPDIVVCEASSLIDFGDPLSENKGEREAPTLSVRRNYVIQTATKIQTKLNANREAVIGITNGSQWLDNDDVNLPDDIMQNPSKYFKEVYTIHTPIFNGGTGTNYRLAEKINNYYVGSNEEPINQVRWRWYNESGEFIGSEIKTQPEGHPATTDYSKEPVANIKHLKFQIEDVTIQYIRYLTAEVRNENGEWYPVSFQKIVLDPYSAPMTVNELENAATNNFAYSRRLERILEDPNRYELIKGINFDATVVEQLSVDNNTAIEPYAADTYYAFAYPSNYNVRGNGSRTTGRGEYGLYRSLNYPNISQEGQDYQDYFIKNGYNHFVIDRLADSSEKTNYGYFMYVDAADEPGVIAKIPFTETLCSNTSLIVTAWVCNLQHSPYEGETGVSPADIGITFKGIKDGEETIITKFYSGELLRKHDGSDNPNDATQAFWQQIYFNFTNTTNIDYDSYLVELSNNTRSSNGADYAIDDIRVYRSLPAIDVSRLDACESSQLYVSSDYQTILNNMGWDLDDNVINKTGVDIKDFNTRKYRYGFLTNEIIRNNEKVGNVYFSVLDGDKYDNNESPEIEWVIVNKKLVDETNPNVANLAYTIRAVVPTNIDASSFPKFPETKDEALLLEIEANIQAMEDFNGDCISKFNGIFNKPTDKNFNTIDLSAFSGKTGEEILNNQELYKLYEQNVKDFYSQLEIPRIHIPWASEADRTAGVIYLTSIDVDNTDMRFVGEQDVEGKEASGHYKVYLFSAAEIVKSQNAGGFQPHPESSCALVSDFYVLPSIVIKVDTESQTGDVSCLGEVHHVTAELVQPDLDENGYETGNLIEVTNVNYNFDWYLGSLEEYDALNPDGRDLKTIIYDLRSNSDDPNIIDGSGSITSGEVESSLRLSDDEKRILLALLAPPSKLRTGKAIDFQLVDEIVAMPYVDNSGSEDTKRLYCTELQAVKLEANANVPELSPGFPNVDYAAVQLTNVPLRIGLRHIQQNETLSNVPIQKEITLGVDQATNNVLKEMTGNTDILLEVNGNYQTVATLEDLFAENDGENNFMTFTFSQEAAQFFEEGQKYDLLVPFGEFASKDANTPIAGSCEGYAHLFIKIVPEYLTWQGISGAVWYNDESSWKQSNGKELYMGNQSENQDVNGDDDVNVFTYSPLYFTKITIPNGEQLTLDEPKKNGVNDIVLGFGDKNSVATANIQYDMAVDTVIDADAQDKLTVVPYYINKVSEIYFKPEATLMNQHYLFYDTARVEFTMKQNTPYWMASPLKEVYAGDLYAPTGGTQNTSAFNHIVFNETKYDRWSPAFYQKAWNKAVAYMDSDEETVSHDSDNAIDVSAVKSNWSIEYNDVWVPYPIGKGFYASVEGVAGDEVTVRLPKADTEYLYYQTKAANNLSPDPKFSDGRRRITDENGVVTGGAGQLATEKPTFTRNENFAFSYSSNGNVTLNLNDVYGESSTDIDQGEHRHFLVGNPYMTYLDMEEFLNVNNGVLTGKYWTLENGAPNAVVGTPDVDFEGDNRTLGSVSGTVKPMTAFFVELKNEATSTIITFTDKMMASTEQTATPETKSLTASNPILTLTAERGETRSVARLLTSDKGHDAYEASEDAVLLLDSELDAPMVYTVASDVAAQFNTMQSIKNVPLGVYADKGEEVELTIRGISQFAEKLYLYDAVTKQSTPLDDDSYTFRVTGPSHGRFTLTSQNRISAESDICVYSPIPGQLLVMSSPEEPLQRVQVYDMSGRMVTSRDNIGNTTSQLTVPSGIYVVYAENETGNVRVKVRVR